MRFLVVVFLFFGAVSVFAQYDHEAVFEGETGETLREMVVEAYKPDVVLTYSQARDTMYGIIYNVNDSIAGIYSDHKVYLQPGEDPSTFIFMNGIANGINAEHSYPQSKGAGNGNARSDMHHLFPSRVNVNSARGSLPFGEINDNITDVWYYKTQEKSSIPSSSIIDRFSEKGNNFFEPREEVKGNIARAIMYFYTIYRNEAMSADPGFFGIMQETLCDWHDADPVDQLEWERTKMIASWQEGKENPFVLDCTLASRIYCGNVSAACTAVNVVNNEWDNNIYLVENPVSNSLRLHIGGHAAKKISLKAYSIVDISGRIQVLNYSMNTNFSQDEELQIPTVHLTPGVYTIQCIIESPYATKTVVLKFIKTP